MRHSIDSILPLNGRGIEVRVCAEQFHRFLGDHFIERADPGAGSGQHDEMVDAARRPLIGDDADVDYTFAQHTIEAMVDDYRRVIALAIEAGAPHPSLPAHLRSDGTERLTALLQPFGPTILPWS